MIPNFKGWIVSPNVLIIYQVLYATQNNVHRLESIYQYI